MPDDSPVTLNLRVLAATVILLVVTALLFGLVPALRLSRVHLGTVMARMGRQRGSTLSRRGGQILITAEVALAVILVAGAGLMIRSFLRISAVDLGFDRGDLVAMEVLPLERTPAAQMQFYASLLQRVRGLAAISSAGIVDSFALGNSAAFSSVLIDQKEVGVGIFEATPGYLETLGASITAGRLPTDTEFASGARLAVISERAAKEMFDGAAVGRQFKRIGPDERPWTVIGVIKGLMHNGPLAHRQDPQVFFPLDVSEFDLNTSMVVVMRSTRTAASLTGGGLAAIVPAMRAAKIDPATSLRAE